MARRPFAQMPSHRILTRTVRAECLTNEKAQRRKRRIHPIPVITNLFIDQLTQLLWRHYGLQRSRRLVAEPLAESINLNLQPFSC